MDALHVAVALGPLAVYLLYVGGLNLRRTPHVVSGGWDLALLFLGASGLVVVGPIELLLPEQALALFGPWTWLMLSTLYLLAALLVVLIQRPRIVAYNATADVLRGALAEVALEIDGEARFNADSLLLPQLGVHLAIDHVSPLRNVSLVSVGPRQSFEGWSTLAAALAGRLGAVHVGRNPRGYSFVALGLALFGLVGWRLLDESPALAQQLENMLRL